MNRQEHDRENLLRDATAYVRRIELRTPTVREVFVGFRSGGGASVYFDQDPVYHFTSTAALRRAYRAGHLIKADRGRLITMHRERPGGEMQLVGHLMSDQESQQLLVEITRALAELADQIDRAEVTIVGQVPEEADLLGEVKDWLAQLRTGPPTIAPSPHAS